MQANVLLVPLATSASRRLLIHISLHVRLGLIALKELALQQESYAQQAHMRLAQELRPCLNVLFVQKGSIAITEPKRSVLKAHTLTEYKCRLSSMFQAQHGVA